MPVITNARAFIRTEETKETAAVSSSVVQKIGGAVNFLEERVDYEVSWKINGNFGSGTGAATDYIDGAFFLDVDAEIVFFGAFIADPGSTFNNVMNIDVLPAGGSATSIFSTPPRFEPTAADNASIRIRYNPDETFENPTGTVLPVFTSRNLSKGDMLLFKMNSRGVEAKNITVNLKLRAR